MRVRGNQKLPFQERKTIVRGVADILTGSYPRFLFGGSISNILPMFHFHDHSTEYLEPYFQYLKENDYRTVTSEAIGDYVIRGKHPGERTVVLSFDDAWSSLWTVVVPLLRKYDLTAITYAVPGRMRDADSVRPFMGQNADVLATDKQENPFVTWPELKSMSLEGRVDVQAHTYSHAMIFCSDYLDGFVEPERSLPFLSHPALSLGDQPVFVTNEMYGCPLYAARSRMSDAVRFVDNIEARNACLEYVQECGDKDFFKRADWQNILREKIGDAKGTFETPVEQRESMLEELVKAKAVLEEKLNVSTIRQICMPWGVCGNMADELCGRAGYETVVADSFPGKRYVFAGMNPHRVMRLKHHFIYCLPGKGRRNFFSARY